MSEEFRSVKEFDPDENLPVPAQGSQISPQKSDAMIMAEVAGKVVVASCAVAAGTGALVLLAATFPKFVGIFLPYLSLVARGLRIAAPAFIVGIFVFIAASVASSKNRC